MKEKNLYDKMGIFGACPIYLIHDRRLGPNAFKVYITLMSFQGNNSNSFPKLEAIAERGGFLDKDGKPKITTVSKAIRNLKETGWVKVRKQGPGKPNLYECNFITEPIDAFYETDKRRNNSANLSHLHNTDSLNESNNLLNIDKQNLLNDDNSNLSMNDNQDLQMIDKPYIEKNILKENIKDHNKRTIADSSPFDNSLENPDFLFRKIRETFIAGSKELGVKYYHNGKEAKCIKEIEKRIKHFYLDNVEDAAEGLLMTFYNQIKHENSNYWSLMTFSPSKFLSNFDTINMLYAQRKKADEEAKEIIKEFNL